MNSEACEDEQIMTKEPASDVSGASVASILSRVPVAVSVAIQVVALVTVSVVVLGPLLIGMY